MASMGVVAANESTLITLSNQDTKQGRHILVRVQRGEKKADHIWYCIGRNTMLHHLILDYTQRVGVASNSVRFLYDGCIIGQFSTPSHLNMEDGDIIDVINVSDKFGFIDLVTENPIVVNVKGLRQDQDPFRYRIGNKTPLRDLMLDYCRQFDYDFDNVRFIFAGKQIDSDKTADDLGFKDECVVHALHRLWGC